MIPPGLSPIGAGHEIAGSGGRDASHGLDGGIGCTLGVGVVPGV